MAAMEAQQRNQKKTLDNKRTRVQYRELTEKVLKAGDVLEDATDDVVFKNIMANADQLLQRVSRTREGVYDANVFKDITEKTKKRADKLGSVNLFNLKDLLQRIKFSFGECDDDDEDETDEAAPRPINWEKLGQSSSWIFRRQAPAFDVMLGPLKYTPPKRVQSQRRAGNTGPKGPVVTAEEVEEIEDHQAYTSQLTKVIHEIMLKQGRVKLYSLLVDPDDYSHTIENIFAFAFLARDGKVDITEEKGILYTSIVKNGAANAETSMKKTQQFVMAMDFNKYQKIVAKENLSSCLVPARNTAVQSTIYKTKPASNEEAPSPPAGTSNKRKSTDGAVSVKKEKRARA